MLFIVSPITLCNFGKQFFTVTHEEPVLKWGGSEQTSLFKLSCILACSDEG